MSLGFRFPSSRQYVWDSATVVADEAGWELTVSNLDGTDWVRDSDEWKQNVE